MRQTANITDREHEIFSGECLMFKINDYVVYNSIGVYKIIDIITEKVIKNRDTVYYVLQPAYRNNLTIKTPVHNPKVFMRNIITKDKALSLIASMPEKESIWIDDDRERNKYFKETLKTAESEELVKLIKSIYLEKQRRARSGRKLTKKDEDI
jgi:CarD family transcriptional regulator